MEAEVRDQKNLTLAPSTQVQSTLGGEFTRLGIGLHTGLQAQVQMLPATIDSGRTFIRVDLPGSPEIPAHIDAVGQTMLSTELAANNATVRTVEHLLAALVGMGVDNARIEIDGAEAPLLDGSAQEWTAAIAQVGVIAQPAPAQPGHCKNLFGFVKQMPLLPHSRLLNCALPTGLILTWQRSAISGIAGHPMRIILRLIHPLLLKLPQPALLAWLTKLSICVPMG